MPIRFASVCRVVNGIRNARYGQVGARPDAFWTCRYNEKALQELGVTVVTLDLSEVLAAVRRMRTSPSVKKTVDHLRQRGAEVVGVCVLIDRSKGEAAFDCRYEALATFNMESWDADNCALCQEDVPVIEPDDIKI